MIDRILQVLAPHSCCGCGLVGSILCYGCKNDITSDPFPNCLVCLRPTLRDNLCETCQLSSGIDGAWCVGTRDTQLKALLDRYKFDSAVHAGRICADLLDERLPVLPADTVIVATPTTSNHQRTRGFDHTLLMAKRFAKMRNLKHIQVLSRTDNGIQHFKTRNERLKTAADGLITSRIVPESIVLIDDIYTTGATIQACTTKLRSAGVKNLFVAIIARQTLDDHRDL